MGLEIEANMVPRRGYGEWICKCRYRDISEKFVDMKHTIRDKVGTHSILVLFKFNKIKNPLSDR